MTLAQLAAHHSPNLRPRFVLCIILAGGRVCRGVARMLVKSTTDWSRAANALLLGALFFPLLPVLSALIQYTLGAALGCQFSSGGACLIAGVDLARSSAHAAGAVNAMVRASAGVALLYYIMLLTVLAQSTSSGFRGRIVRTSAVTMSAGVLPVVLSLAAFVPLSGTVQCSPPAAPATRPAPCARRPWICASGAH